MAKLLYNILLGYVCFSLASFVLFQSQIIPYNLPVGWQPISSSSNIIADLFSINAFTVLLGIGGGIAIGVVGFLLKQGINAVYALVIFVFGVIFTPVQQMVTSLPITLALFFTGELSYLVVVIMSVVSFAVFIFFIELLAQRSIS